MKCPFCQNHILKPNPGKSTCLKCGAKFEIDDRAECIFADPNDLKLPVDGQVCRICGLIQDKEMRRCAYCGAELNLTVH